MTIEQAVTASQSPGKRPFAGKQRLHNVVDIRLTQSFLRQPFNAQLLELNVGDAVIVETSKGPVIATVASEVHRAVVPTGTLKRVLRRANSEDLRRAESHAKREEEAFRFALQRG